MSIFRRAHNSHRRLHLRSKVLNRDASSACPETVSVFRNGSRVAGPIALHADLAGKPLFPYIAFRAATVTVSRAEGIESAN